MIVYITTVLLMAAFQSFCKLALLKRRWELLLAALLFPLPFVFENAIARTSMQTLNVSLSNAATLENWCALVVIQELFTLTAGFSLLDDRSRSDRIKPGLHRCLKSLKYLVFLPSVLLPAGVLYLQMYLFNTLPGISFRTLSWLLACGLPLTLILVPEAIRLLRRDRDERLLLVLHAEFLLVLPAVFLPVAANARLTPDENAGFPADSLLVLAALAGFVGLSGIGCKIFENHRRKKTKCQRLLKS